MSLPNVSIEILNNQLGRVAPTDDAVMGLVVSGVATDDLALATPLQIFSLTEAEDVGIDAAYDTTNTTDAWKQIKEFYDRAGTGTELWIMVIAKTQTMAAACDKANNVVKLLLNTASGRIRMVGISRVPDGGYTPTFDDGLDDDVTAAVLKLHELLEDFATAHKPCRGLIGGRDFQGVPANLASLRTYAQNRVGVVLCSITDDGSPAVGFALGQFANRPVQRNIGRVKDGDLSITDAYLTDGETIETYETALDAIHDKGYIILRKFYNKNGYFFNDDPSCSPLTDDYSSLARGRVIDKAHVIAYQTFVDEIQDDLEIDEAGFMDAAVVKSYQQKIEAAITLQMVPDEASGVRCDISPAQQLLEADTVTITKLAIRPRGYAKYIEVPLGFENPVTE